MKRSEMIKALENEFIGDIREHAELILEFLEKKGMKPPERELIKEVADGYGGWQEEIHSSYDDYYADEDYLTWTPE